MPLGMEVGIGPDDFVLDVDSAWHSPKLSAHVYCDHTAGWMKTPVGTEVDLGPGHCVRRGLSSPVKRAHQPTPVFSACCHGCPSELLLSSCSVYRPKTSWIGSGYASLGQGDIALDEDRSMRKQRQNFHSSLKPISVTPAHRSARPPASARSLPLQTIFSRARHAPCTAPAHGSSDLWPARSAPGRSAPMFQAANWKKWD